MDNVAPFTYENNLNIVLKDKVACDGTMDSIHHGKYYSDCGVLLTKSKLNECILECNEQCLCDYESCPNRVAQKSALIDFQVCRSIGKGFGLFSTVEIGMGSLLIEYLGEIISTKEAAIRYAKANGKPNYVLSIREELENSYLVTNIDASRFGNASRFINHSCAPNATMEIVRSDSLVPRIFIFAKMDIRTGEEITMSYGNSIGKVPCQCGVESCVGFLPLERR